MFGKLGNIRKRGVALAHFFPIFGGELVTRVTPEFLFGNVSGMRKACVINRASLSLSRSDGQSKSDYCKCH